MSVCTLKLWCLSGVALHGGTCKTDPGIYQSRIGADKCGGTVACVADGPL